MTCYYLDGCKTIRMIEFQLQWRKKRAERQNLDSFCCACTQASPLDDLF